MSYSLSAGTNVDRYRILGALSRGGMAEVYAAVHRGLHIRHALKVLHQPEMAERLLLEGRWQAGLDSPFIVPVTDVVTLDHGAPVLVMPLVDGCALSELIGGVPLPSGDVDYVVWSIAKGLQHAHAAEIIHRDLKPANVLVDVSHGQLRVRVADFGIAKGPGSGHTEEHRFLGTPAYCSPEHLESTSHVDAATDLWSLGVVVFELLTGVRPFEAPREPSELVRSAAALDLEGLTPVWRARARALLDPDPTSRLSLHALLRDLEEGGVPEPIQGASRWAARVLELAERRRIDDPASSDLVARSETETGARRHNLPPERELFVGRAEVLDHVETWLDQAARCISLVGAGGFGKTRLALRVARRNLGRFRGGVYFCDLTGAQDADQMSWVLGRALDAHLPESAPDEAVRRVLAARGPCLVVLDNLEHLLPEGGAQVVLGWFERAPQATLLITTQVALGIDDEVRIEVGPLDQGSAVALFEARAQRVQAGFEVSAHPAVMQLVDLVDRMPLAIGLLAGRVQVLTPANMLARLSDDNGVLALAAKPGRTGRHDALQKTIEWSWGLLTTWAQSTLAQLSVFRGGFDLEAFEEVVALAANEEVRWPPDALQWLVDRSLVRPVGAGRFELYNSVRAFAEQKRIADGSLAGTGARHAVHYARLGDAAAIAAIRRRGGAEVKRRLVRELDNLVAACEHAVVHGDARAAALTGRAAWTVLAANGPMAEGLKLLEAVAGMGTQHEALRAVLECDLGEAKRLLALPGSVAHLERAVELAGATDDARTRVLAQIRVGWARIPGDATSAIPFFEQALHTAQEDGDPWLQLEAKLHLGQALRRVQRADEVDVLLQSVSESARRLGDARAEAVATDQLGLQAMVRGAYDVARRLLTRAVDAAKIAEHRRTLAVSLTNLGVLNLVSGHFESARTQLEDATQAHLRSGDVHNHVLARFLLGCLEAQLGWAERAVPLLHDAVENFAALGDCRQVEALTQHALLELSRGRQEAAGALLTRAEGVEAELDAYTKGHLDRVQGLLAESAGDHVEACALLERARGSFAADPFVQGEGMTLADMARTRVAEGDLVAAAQCLDDCRTTLEGDPNPLVRCLRLCAEVHLHHASGERAKAAGALALAQGAVEGIIMGRHGETNLRLRKAREVLELEQVVQSPQTRH